MSGMEKPILFLFLALWKADSNKLNNLKQFQGFSKMTWTFISSIYETGWDELEADNNNKIFR